MLTTHQVDLNYLDRRDRAMSQAFSPSNEILIIIATKIEIFEAFSMLN